MRRSVKTSGDAQNEEFVKKISRRVSFEKIF